MTPDQTLTSTSTYLAVLTQAALGNAAERPTAATVVAALLQAEKDTKQQRLFYALDSLFGDWRLCFVTGTRKVRQRAGIVLGKGFYLPPLVPAQISFHPPGEASEPGEGRATIANQVQVGLVKLTLTGPANYLGKKNLMAFDFNQAQLSLLDRVVYSGKFGRKTESEAFYEQAIAKLPFFAFFLVTPDFIAARGRGGGLALWARTNSQTS